MPIISRFNGMIIKMYFQQSEHNPPYFHVIYGEYTSSIDIRTLEMLEGDLPKKRIGSCHRMGKAKPNYTFGNLEYPKVPSNTADVE